MRTTVQIGHHYVEIVVSKEALEGFAKLMNDAREVQGKQFIKIFNTFQSEISDFHKDQISYNAYSDLTDVLNQINAFQVLLARKVELNKEETAKLLFLLQDKEKAKENFSLFMHKVEASLATLIERNKSLKETRTQQMTLQLDVMPDVKPLLHALKSDSVKLNELSVILESLKLPELYQRFPQAVEYFNSLRDECKSFLEKTVKIFLDLKKVSLDVVSLAKDYAALQTQLDQESIPSAQLTVDTLTAKVELLKSKAKELSDQKAEDVVVQPEKVKKHTSRQKVTSDMFFSPDDKSARASHTHQSLRERMKKYLPPEHEQQADLQNLLKAKSEPLPVQTEPAQPQSSAKPGGFKEFGAFGESHKKAKESAHSSKKDKKKTEKGASKTPYK